MTTKLAAVGVASASLAIPAATAFAQSAPQTGEQPASRKGYLPFAPEDQPVSQEQIDKVGWMSGAEADRLGISAKIPEAYPEAPAGVIPPGYLEAQRSVAAATTPCPADKQCMWTGGYFAGPGRSLNGGHAGTYWNWSEAKCVGSGSPGGNWKNCASSLKNLNGGFGFTVYINSGNEDAGTYKNVPQGDSRPQLGSFDNNIEKSVGYGIP